jgi:GNAT superfamily N-acetyltransferase
MKSYEFITEAVDVKNTVDDVYKAGVYDATLIVSVDGEQAGYLSYSVYKNVPAIKMIWVSPNYRRQKIAVQMLKSLQSMFPTEEIDWGYTTDDGSALKQNINFRSVPNTKVSQTKTKLIAVRSQLAKLSHKLETLQKTDVEKARKFVQAVSDRWNNLHDLAYKLENQLSTMGSEYTKFIDDKLNERLR